MINKTQNEIMKNWQLEQGTVVSIHCLAFNHEKFIAQALDSFLQQETNFPFEVIVHDDASTDKTAEIIREYEICYPKIIKPIYETENQYSKGGSHLITDIIAKYISGKYVAFCEGDDFWNNEKKLQKQVDWLEKFKAYSGCVGACLVLEEKTGEYRPREKKYPSLDLEIEDFIGPTIGHTSTIMMRREIYLKRLDSTTPKVFSGDKLLLLLMRLNGKVAFLPEIFSVYRKNDGGVSRNVKLKRIEQDLQIPQWASQLYSKANAKYPYFRHLSFIYQTIFLYTTDLNAIQKFKYGFLFFFTSFSYFPKNIYRIIQIIKARITDKKYT